MTLDERLREVAVIGAAGKMGRGIAELLAREVFVDPRHRGVPRRLVLIDPAREAHDDLLAYLEASIEGLFDDPQAVLVVSDRLEDCRGARLVFEAASEDESLKVAIFSRLGVVCPEAVFLSNTSSIPIGRLEEAASLSGRLLGFHFYNPPPRQRLVELVLPSPALAPLAEEIAARLGKRLVRSRDVAGFIGNGHFIREALASFAVAERCSGELGRPAAILALDTVTRDALLRPMGIFRLVDFVGLDVFAAIAATMGRYLACESFESHLLEAMAASGLRGGQLADGRPREGFFQYAGRDPVAVRDVEGESWVPVSELEPRVREWLGCPDAGPRWKELREWEGDRAQRAAVEAHFRQLRDGETRFTELGREALARSRAIAELLVGEGVAASIDDVETVLVEGFHHLYAPTRVPGE